MPIARKRRAEATIPSSAMSDIAFLLLVFFMLSSFAEVDKEIPIELPESRISIQEDEKFFNVWVDNDGTVYFNNEAGSLSGLSSYATRRLIQDPEVEVLIRAPKEVQYTTINGVLEALKDGGIHRVVFVSMKE